MPSLVFVHGTGVREDSFLKTYQSIGRNLAGRNPDINLVMCCWGVDLGVPQSKKFKSVPDYENTGGNAGNPDDEDSLDSAGRWDLLREDPLLELKVLAQRESRMEKALPGQKPPSARIRSELENLPKSDSVETALVRLGWATSLPAAVHRILRFPDLGESIKAANALAALGANAGDAGRNHVARAIVAVLEQDAMARGDVLLMPEERKILVQCIFVGLGGTGGEAKGLLGDLFKKAFKPIASLGNKGVTWYVRNNRGMTTDAVTPALGDILLYQAHGERIQEFIRERIKKVPGPIYVLAHSLGGIASFEMLASEPLADVEGFITAGSQAPFFHELGALKALKAGQELPGHFPRWLNFYDRNDILSYLARPVFGDRVEDFEVQSRQPLLAAHSAYWTNESFWQRLLTFVR